MLLVYPWLWIGTSFFCLVQILSQPFWGVLYVIDKDLFIYDKTTAVSDVYEYEAKNGIPSVLAKAYNFYGLLWADTTYLVDNTDLSLRFEDFV